MLSLMFKQKNNNNSVRISLEVTYENIFFQAVFSFSYSVILFLKQFNIW